LLFFTDIAETKQQLFLAARPVVTVEKDDDSVYHIINTTPLKNVTLSFTPGNHCIQNCDSEKLEISQLIFILKVLSFTISLPATNAKIPSQFFGC
jgi:hypothetical protein